ncbi:hypothetical protein F5B22DRAFT_641293 [Xylaria bambusicola]|uniref:uncharacterized protein n=1 Tax=Xylaria bambusicola TaxID=326684 RepID=UPI0020089544|nr:uncharacterized protein F5B22DRAFT_641293 [Xylaria bambusicola]KAI0528320.1 hypothetical protein F5B22DRAFT_641293 [Xylaria bambusicola]
MAGNGSTEPSIESVRAAMMDDLGPHRLEELARDDSRISRQRQARVIPPIPPRVAHLQTRGSSSKGLAEKWCAAIREGEFDDDDAAAVKGLDPLDSGNAHRINRLGGQSDRRQHNPTQAENFMGPVKRAREPTYSRKFKLASKDPNVSHRQDMFNATPGGPVLGGLCPEGGEVKRWNSGKQVEGFKNITNLPNLPTSRGQTPNRSRGSPEKSIQTPGHVRGRGRGGGGAQPPSRPSPRHESMTFQPQEHINENSGRLPQPPQSPRDTSWVPPHLRKSSGSRSPASPSAAVSRQTSPRPSQLTIGDSTPSPLEKLHETTNLNAREVFFQDNVTVVQYGEPNLPTRGQITIYELLDAPVCIWELAIEGKETKRGDIRELLEVLENGSTSYLRRHRAGGPVRSNPLQFSDINKAKKFVQEANLRRIQYIGSSETIYDEITLPLSLAQNAAVCKAAVEPVDEKTQQIVKPRPQTPPKAAAVNHQRMESGWSDKDLISFSPGPTIQSQQNNGGTRFEREQSVIVKMETSSGLSAQNQADHEELVSKPMINEGHQVRQEVKPRNRAEEATKALRNVEVDIVRHLSHASLELVAEISDEYDQLTHRSTLLSIALDTPHRDPAFLTTLTHLAQKPKFLDLSRDDQKDCLSVICSIVRHGDARIVRSQEEIRALRSEEACPEAIKELNALIQRQRGGVPISQPTHVRSSTADTMTMLVGQLEMLSMK